MENEDYDEDIYEETKSKVVYKRVSSASDPKLKERGSDFDERSRTGRSKYSERKNSRITEDQDEWTATATINLANKNNKRMSQTGQRTLKEESQTRSRSTSDARYDPRQQEWVRTMRKSRSPKKEKYPRDRSGSTKKTSFVERMQSARDTLSKDGFYHPVDKWEVDYNNKNYIRSQCLKPLGLHRYGYGQPFDWDIGYNNRYYLISKVNYPKGMHRQTYEFKRKRVPDDDVLADATGWEFEYGPEFSQIEGDIPFYPRERIVGKGGYRFYGVRRNNSDCDRVIEETPEDFQEIFEEDYKYGHEFLQDDIPHIVEFKDMRIGRGGYRFIDVERNKCDMKPTDVLGLDYRASRASIHTDIKEEEEEEVPRKGKPFKQTIFKKTFRLIKPPSVEDFTHGTALSFIPGAGSKDFYEGKSTRPSRGEIKKHPSKREVFPSRKKTGSYEMQTPRKRGSEFGERRYKDEVSEKDASLQRHRSLDEFLQGEELRRQERKPFTPHDYRGSESTETGERHGEEKRERHRFPPDVQTRIDEIRSITRDISPERNKKDWKRHEHHPHDTGKSVTEGYEKYVNKRGSEIWIKTEETHSEFHHKKKNQEAS